MANQKYIQSHNERQMQQDRYVELQTFVYTGLITGILFGVSYGCGHLNKEKGFVPNNSFTNRLEMIR